MPIYTIEWQYKEKTMTLTQFINYIQYSTVRPARITSARWNGMIKYAKKHGIIS